MVEKDLKQYFNEKIALVDQRLYSLVSSLTSEEKLKESMMYSIQAGGKRIRPILLLATMEAFNKDQHLGLDVACALEMIHTYSLIHDDLPAMDDDDLRRGKPTNHKVFGEATAILAGDGLLTYSFEVISKISHPSISNEMKLSLILELAMAAGPEGMVTGQASDMEAEKKSVSLNELEKIHREKTGKLLSYPIIAGAILSSANDMQLEHLKQFAQHLGLSFQIKDDILDVEGDQEVIGKPVGSDEQKDKSTYPKLLTLDGAKEKCIFHLEKAKEHLLKAQINHSRLLTIADYIVYRNK